MIFFIWSMQTLMMMIPFIMGAAVGVMIMGNWPILSFVIGTFFFYLFQSDCFEPWKKAEIIKIQRMFRVFR